MWRGAVIHRSQRLAHDRIEVIGCLQYQTLHFCRILNHRPAMAGAEARRLASRYRAQPVGPVPRVALHLLRVAGGRQTLGTGIDQHQPRFCFERDDPAKIRDEPGARRHFDRSAGPVHPCLIGAFAAIGLETLHDTRHATLPVVRAAPGALLSDIYSTHSALGIACAGGGDRDLPTAEMRVDLCRG
jgi:hypothetical protein